MQDLANEALEMLDQYGIINDVDLAPQHGGFQSSVMFAPGLRIAGGTDEILKNIIADLTDAASVGGLSGARGASAYSRMSTPGSATNELLQSPHFQALEDAIAKGDPLGMRAAWAMLISGSLNFAASTRRNPSAAPPSYGFTQTRAVAAI